MNERAPAKKRRKRSRGNRNSGRDTAPKKGQKSRRKEPKVDPVEFWGDSESLPEPHTHVATAPDVGALVSSLGRPPITGQETAAEHWFSLVYERAAVLAGALAAAGGLDQPAATENDID